MQVPLFLSRLSIAQRLATIPILFSVGVAILLGVKVWQSAEAEKSSSRINLAARQQMLIQRFTLEVLQEAAGSTADHSKTGGKLLESLSLLEEGGAYVFGEIPEATESTLIDATGHLKRQFDRQFETADRYLAAVESGSDTAMQLRRELIVQTDQCDDAAQAIISRISELDSETRAVAQFRASFVGVLVALLASGWSIICGKSVSSQIGRSVKEVQHLSIHELTDVSHQLRQNAAMTSDQATMASGAAEEVSANAQSLASAVEQFEVSIKEIAGNASTAASVARNAVEAVDETNTTITRLGESSTEIGNVIKVINSIAEQTNLLALNATIEAARAGEAGKGFAVVANEVKELAKETSMATEDIIGRIGTIQSDTHLAVTAIERVSEIISEINESQNAIAGAVEEQTAMTSEISRNISEVAVGSGEIAQSIASVAEAASSTTAGSDETLQTAEDIESLAHELMDLVGETREAVGRRNAGRHDHAALV